MNWIKTVFDLFKETFVDWNADKAPRLAAAVAYYVALSLAPLMVLVILIVGVFFSEASVQSQIVEQVNRSIGPTAGELVNSLIDSANSFDGGLFSTVIGLGTLLFASVNVFSQLRGALNAIWGVEETPQVNGFLGFVIDKTVSLGMVLVFIFLLLVSLIISTLLSVLDGVLAQALPDAVDFLLSALSLGISFGLITVLFALIYRFLPNAHIEWRDVWVGAAITSGLFTLGETLLGLYLANSSTASVYGAAGSFVLILLWIYYSAQIVLFGAEFTQVYARRYGSRIQHAVPFSGIVNNGESADTGSSDDGEGA